MANRKFTRRASPSNKGWAGVEIAEQTIAGNTAILLTTLVLSNPGIDETHLRALGTFFIASDQGATSENQVGALGMIVVSTQAISVGITAIPHPVTDINDDGWFWHMPFASRLEIGDNTSARYSPMYHMDSKAKRVVHDGESIALVVENATAQGIIIGGILRVLSMVRGT